METTSKSATINPQELRQKVKKMYRDVALDPWHEYHFETGRRLAEKLGYDHRELDLVPAEAINSFAGVGYFFDLIQIKNGDRVLDAGSGSGMDSFLASLKAGSGGKVTGVDMTDEQLEKSVRIAKENNISNVEFVNGLIDQLPFPDESFDVIISNGVINLVPDKEKVFAEFARVLKVGGKIAIADIVSETQLPETITCDSDLWASCIGGASQQDSYREAIEKAGLKVHFVRNNSSYHFISKSAINASAKYGVKSISLYAEKL